MHLFSLEELWLLLITFFSLILKGSGATDLPCPSDTFDTTGNTYTYSGTAGNSMTLKFTSDNQQEENGFMAVYYETSKSMNFIIDEWDTLSAIYWSSCTFLRAITEYVHIAGYVFQWYKGTRWSDNFIWLCQGLFLYSKPKWTKMGYLVILLIYLVILLIHLVMLIIQLLILLIHLLILLIRLRYIMTSHFFLLY